MSNQEMSHRLYDILSTKASLGMGRDSDGLLERYGHGVMAGTGPSKRSKSAAEFNPWIHFIKEYSERNGISYKDALKSKKACTEYRNLANYTTKQLPCKRTPVKRKPVKKSNSKAPKRKVTKKKCPKGKVAIPIHGYSRSDGTKIKKYEKCIKNIMKKY